MPRDTRSSSIATYSVLDPPVKIPADWQPDRFEERYGIIGNYYNTKDGLRHIGGFAPVAKVYKLNRSSRPVADQILKLLEICEKVNSEQVADHCKITRKTALNALYRLSKLGEISKNKSGKTIYYARSNS